MDIRPEYLPLSQLLERRLFRIPDYQRSYSWTSRQRTDLFEDIETVHASGPDANHFMATVVCLRRREQLLGTDNYHMLDVVDGQQRLTTVVLLFKAIQLALEESKSDEDASIAQDLRKLLIKGATGELLLLQTNHDASHYFSDFLRNGTSKSPDEADTIADRELLSAITECLEFVADWVDRGNPLRDLVTLLKNRLSFILFEISQERQVYTVFEVLNSRGIEVSWLDRLKTILMGAAFELEEGDSEQLIKDLHVIWRDIYATVGLRQGLSTEALRFAATLWGGQSHRPLGEQAAVDLLRESTGSAEDIRGVAGWLLEVTKACDAVLSNNRIDAVTRIVQARLLAVAINMMDIEESDRIDLLGCWERVSFRIYGMSGNDSRTGVGDYVRVARRCVEDDALVEEIRERILRIGALYPIDSAIACLRETNCYEGWQDELRYMLYRYEEHLAEREGNNFSNENWLKIWMNTASRSIEHIWAQSEAPEEVRHNLGNLMMLPPRLNSKLQDKPFRDKKAAYTQTGLLDARAVGRRRRWSKQAIRQREREILEWAAVEWAD